MEARNIMDQMKFLNFFKIDINARSFGLQSLHSKLLSIPCTFGWFSDHLTIRYKIPMRALQQGPFEISILSNFFRTPLFTFWIKIG